MIYAVCCVREMEVRAIWMPCSLYYARGRAANQTVPLIPPPIEERAFSYRLVEGSAWSNRKPDGTHMIGDKRVVGSSSSNRQSSGRSRVVRLTKSKQWVTLAPAFYTNTQKYKKNPHRWYLRLLVYAGSAEIIHETRATSEVLEILLGAFAGALHKRSLTRIDSSKRHLLNYGYRLEPTSRHSNANEQLDRIAISDVRLGKEGFKPLCAVS